MAALGAWLAWAIKQLGLAGCAIVLILVYFLGVPWGDRIPFIGHVPFVGDIATGYVERERRQAAVAAKKGMVSTAQLAATKAELLKLQRELDFAEQQAASAMARKLAADAAYTAKIDELEMQINEDDDPDISRWTERDFERLR